MSKRGLPGVGKRKDGKERVKLTLLVTPRSIEGAREVDPSVSRAFEEVFEDKGASAKNTKRKNHDRH